MNEGDNISTKQAYRWAVVLTVTVANLFANLWCWGSILIGSAMGWNGWSNIEIALVVAPLLVFPVVVAWFFGKRAIFNADKGDLVLSFKQTLVALLCTPIAWALLNAGIFPL